MRKFVLNLLVLIPFTAFAQATDEVESDIFPQQMSARKLLDACASSAMTSTGRERRKYCSGFISGVEEAMRHLKLRHGLEQVVCLPDRVSSRALTEVYIRFAAKRQAELDIPAAALVREALLDAYPCKRE